MQKVGWLIYSKVDADRNRSFIKWFIEEAKQQNIKLLFIPREDLTISIVDNKRIALIKNQRVLYPDFAVVRTIEHVLSSFLEMCAVKVFNPSSVSLIANNKSLTHIEINKLSIPMVDTIMIKRATLNQTPPMPYPFIVKEATGRSGMQVHLIETNKHWESCLATLANVDIVIQSSNVQRGKDVRVFIVGKEIIGAVLRESAGDFRANYTLGGSAVLYPLNDNEISTIEKIIHHFDFGMVGIDFLIAQDGTILFNEIEDIVGSRILSKVSDSNILKKYITYIKKNIYDIYDQ